MSPPTGDSRERHYYGYFLCTIANVALLQLFVEFAFVLLVYRVYCVQRCLIFHN